MVDIHTHLLHSIDDGASGLDVSVNMLKQMSEIGVHTVVCTPHFNYTHITPEEFAEIRDERIAELTPYASELGITLLKGCEVYLTDNMLRLTDATPLCIEGTRNILVEFPCARALTRSDLDLLVNFSDYYNVHPIIAHAERYYSVIKNIKFAEKFLAMGGYIQIDAASFFERMYKRAAKSLVKKGFASFIASDAHSDTKRTPLVLPKAYAEIERLFGEDTVEEFKNNAEAVICSFKPRE